MRSSPRILALDFGASHVAGAVFVMNKARQLVLERFAVREYVIDPASDENIAQESREHALASLVAEEQWRGICVMAVPAHLALVKFIKIPVVARARRPEILAFEAAQNIPYPLEEVCWGNYYLATEGSEDLFVVAVAKTEAMETLCASVTAVNLAPEHAMPGGLALWQAWRHQYKNSTESVLLVDVGARSTHVVFATRQRCFARTLPWGGNVITQAVAAELNLEFSRAEALKIGILSGQISATENEAAHGAVSRAAEAFGHRLQQELARAILGYARQSGAIQPTEILITGGVAQWSQLTALLSMRLNLPVHPYDTGKGLGGATAAGPRLAILTGLAVAALEGEMQSLNLLPAAAQKEVVSRRARPWWFAAAALLVLALVPPAWHFQMLADEFRAESERLDNQLGPMRELAARNTGNLARLTTLSRENIALQRLVAAKTSWREFFAGLQHDLTAVGDVWLDRMQVVDDDGAKQYADVKESPTLRLAVSGRLLDTHNPLSKVSADSYRRVKDLFTRIEGSPFVKSLEDEQFDNSKPGILRFDFTMVISEEGAL